MIKKLIKLANHLDKKGLTKEADYLDALIIKNASAKTSSPIPVGIVFRLVYNGKRIKVEKNMFEGLYDKVVGGADEFKVAYPGLEEPKKPDTYKRFKYIYVKFNYRINPNDSNDVRFYTPELANETELIDDAKLASHHIEEIKNYISKIEIERESSDDPKKIRVRLKGTGSPAKNSQFIEDEKNLQYIEYRYSLNIGSKGKQVDVNK